jgi:catechol 2,3-dioxygenase-like lactoylglutathione lyase family enzyme
MKLNQITISVTDIPKSVAFYEGLGIKLIVLSPHYARFIVPENEATFSIHLAELVCSTTTIYFEMESENALNEKVNNLESKGYVFSVQPKMQTWLWYEAYLNDSDGNIICFYFAGENRLNPPWRI